MPKLLAAVAAGIKLDGKTVDDGKVGLDEEVIKDVAVAAGTRGSERVAVVKTVIALVVVVAPSVVSRTGTTLVSSSIPLLLSSRSHCPTVPIIPIGGFTGPVEAARS